MGKKKILFIAPQPFFEIRGTPIAIRDMLSILSKEFDIDLVSYPFGANTPIKNVNHHRTFSLGFSRVKIGISLRKIFLDFALFLTTLKLVSRNRYDFVHAVEEAALIGVFIKKFTRAKMVYDMDSVMSEQVANSKYSKFKFVFDLIERIIIKNSDLILAVSDNFRDFCLTIDPTCNFVEIFDLPQIEKAKLPSTLKHKFAGYKKKALYIGNKEKYQGVELLEETAQLLPDVQFFIIGTGESGTCNNITYIPKIEMKYVWGAMQEVDVLISPRLGGTNTPMKVYTYMASGRPIVATDISAHNILRDCSFIVNKNKTDLKQGIIEAINNQIVARKAEQKIVNKYNRINLEKHILDAYYKLK